MNSRTRLVIPILTLLFPLSGCFGTSDDKGDNGGSVITPKPSKVEDANTAGSRTTVLPEPKAPEAQPDTGAK